MTGQHTYSVSGSYSITITVVDDDGGSGSDAVLVDILSVPTVVTIPSVTFWGMIVLAGFFAVALGVRRHSRPPAEPGGF